MVKGLFTFACFGLLYFKVTVTGTSYGVAQSENADIQPQERRLTSFLGA
jgi:hypothetical protein